MNIDVGNNLEKHEYIKADQHELKMDKYDRLVEERNMIRKRIEDKAENII